MKDQPTAPVITSKSGGWFLPTLTLLVSAAAAVEAVLNRNAAVQAAERAETAEAAARRHASHAEDFMDAAQNSAALAEERADSSASSSRACRDYEMRMEKYADRLESLEFQIDVLRTAIPEPPPADETAAKSQPRDKKGKFTNRSGGEVVEPEE